MARRGRTNIDSISKVSSVRKRQNIASKTPTDNNAHMTNREGFRTNRPKTKSP